MDTMKGRQESFEKKFALDEEAQFKVIARRNKLLGMWAAALLGKSGSDADAYATEVVRSDFEEAGDEDVLRKVFADLQQARVEQSEDQIRAKMDELLSAAAEQITGS